MINLKNDLVKGWQRSGYLQKALPRILVIQICLTFYLILFFLTGKREKYKHLFMYLSPWFTLRF